MRRSDRRGPFQIRRTLSLLLCHPPPHLQASRTHKHARTHTLSHTYRMPKKAGFPSGATEGWTSPNDPVPLVPASWDPVTGGAKPQRNHVGPWPLWASNPTQHRWPLGNAKQPGAPNQAGAGWTPPNEHSSSSSSHSGASSAASGSGRMAKWACRAVGPCHQCSKQEVSQNTSASSQAHGVQRHTSQQELRVVTLWPQLLKSYACLLA